MLQGNVVTWPCVAAMIALVLFSQTLTPTQLHAISIHHQTRSQAATGTPPRPPHRRPVPPKRSPPPPPPLSERAEEEACKVLWWPVGLLPDGLLGCDRRPPTLAPDGLEGSWTCGFGNWPVSTFREGACLTAPQTLGLTGAALVLRFVLVALGTPWSQRPSMASSAGASSGSSQPRSAGEMSSCDPAAGKSSSCLSSLKLSTRACPCAGTKGNCSICTQPDLEP
mmetsp:Transcript_63267/g.205338  ORF Transcript_63267/g.205338 Transcript_63267/m.205338 type:complete len:224 (+) Transcript_63267:129-800(+)